MVAEIILGLLFALQAVLHHLEKQKMREEIRLAVNREYARSVPELAALQLVTKPAKSEQAKARKANTADPLAWDPRASDLPMGL